MTETAFWKTTPYLTGVHVRAYADRIKTQRDLSIAAAWHGEAFARTRQLPDLSIFLEASEQGEVDHEADEGKIRAWAEAHHLEWVEVDS